MLNFGRVTDIERGRRGPTIEPATPEALAHFLDTWTPGGGDLPEAATQPLSLESIHGVLRIDHEKALVRANESDRVEFKQAWNAGQVAEYARSMAAFANNRGGYLIFGVKDGSGEIVGLTSDKFTTYDPAKVSARLHVYIQPELDWTRCVAKICGKEVGVIYVAESHVKPVVGITDQGGIEDGAVYFRYPGETRRIRHLDLINLIQERERRTATLMTDQMGRIAEMGPYDAAILNTSAGEIDLSGRRVLLTKNLRDQIQNIAGGKYTIEDRPLELKGEVGDAGGTGGPVVMRGRVSDYNVVRDFVDRANVANPLDYIRHLLDTQMVWLPLFWFVLLNGKPIAELEAELDKLPKLKPKSFDKLRERLHGKLGRKKAYTYADENMWRALQDGDAIALAGEEEAIEAMKTILAVDMSPENADAIFTTLTNALAVFDETASNKLFSEIRISACFVDQVLYRQKCMELGSDSSGKG